MSFPYSYFSCSCATSSSSTLRNGGPESQEIPDKDVEEENTFDPRSPRTNFSLYPLDNLLWCEDCHDLRCVRCVTDEIICWYCPSCLFEVPSSMVKSEGNRCTRNCFNCPICTAPMSVNTFDIEGVTTNTGPWILACEYCYWTSLDIDIEFQKPNNVYTQLAKLHSDGSHQTPLRREVVVDQSDETLQGRDPDLQFGSLKSFYTSQLAKTTTTNPLMSPSGEFNYNSPSSLARIISLYTGQGSYGKKSIGKTIIMRESADASEGLAIFDKKSEEAEVASLLKKGWQGTTCVAQQIEQVHQHRFVRNLRPIPTLLRTKRSKRCRTCRHILVKPETKVQNTRYRIRLVAINYIPTMTLKPLQLADPSSALPSIKLDALTPSRASQLLLTMKNPMFDPVQITLATPSQTPGRFSSKVTILCPEFDIGPNTDVWDEALNSTTSESRTSIKHARTKAEAGESEARVAEAGKIWEKGRNWTTVVVEVVPAMIGHDEVREDELDEDEDVLEIPVFVRMEYEGDAAGDDAGGARESKEKKEKREVSFWCVLGVGRIAR